MEPQDTGAVDLVPIAAAVRNLGVGERTIRRWLALGYVARHEPARVDGRPAAPSASGGQPPKRVSLRELRAFMAGRAASR